MIRYYLFLIILCFSFLTFVFTLCFNGREKLLKYLGHTFIIPFYLCVFSLIYFKGIPSLEVIAFIELVHMLFFLLVLVRGGNGKPKSNYFLIYGVIVLLSGIFLIYGFQGPIQRFLLVKQLLIILGIINILSFKIKKLKERGLIFGLSWLLMGNAFSYFVVNETLLYGSVVFKFLGFLVLFFHFYSVIQKKLTAKMNEAESFKVQLQESYEEEVERELFNMQLRQESLLASTHFDSMTQAYNRKAILEILDSFLFLGKDPITILMIDIDRFKQINDTNGHVVGDQCIKDLVNILQNNLRKADYVGRYGGDEFIVILPNTDGNDSKIIADKLRLKVNQVSQHKITISIGLASYPEDGNTTMELIEKADSRMYSAKRAGRNMVYSGA